MTPRTAIAAVLAAAAAAALVPGAMPEPFARFFGTLPPWAVAGGAVVLGAVLLWLLASRAGLALGSGRRGLTRAALLAALFAAIVTPADIYLRFPEEMNVALPGALLFYSIIALVAETVFHLLPLAALLVWPGPALTGRDAAALWPWALAVAALPEPVMQVIWSAPGAGPGAMEAFIFLHLAAFSLAELMLFRRHGFAAMLTMRLIYYAWWHILWGALRLQLLF